MAGWKCKQFLLEEKWGVGLFKPLGCRSRWSGGHLSQKPGLDMCMSCSLFPNKRDYKLIMTAWKGNMAGKKPSVPISCSPPPPGSLPATCRKHIYKEHWLTSQSRGFPSRNFFKVSQEKLLLGIKTFIEDNGLEGKVLLADSGRKLSPEHTGITSLEVFVQSPPYIITKPLYWKKKKGINFCD